MLLTWPQIFWSPRLIGTSISRADAPHRPETQERKCLEITEIINMISELRFLNKRRISAFFHKIISFPLVVAAILALSALGLIGSNMSSLWETLCVTIACTISLHCRKWSRTGETQWSSSCSISSKTNKSSRDRQGYGMHPVHPQETRIACNHKSLSILGNTPEVRYNTELTTE